MRKELLIEWKHGRGKRVTCIICTDTGKTLQTLLQEIIPVLEQDGIRVRIVDTDLSGDDSEDTILLNGTPLEELINKAGSGQNYCRSTKCMMMQQEYPRISETDQAIREEAPEILFRKAMLLALEEDQEIDAPSFH
jgi:hypothetical protein